MDKINLTKKTAQVDATELLPLIDLFFADSRKRVNKLTVRSHTYYLNLFRRWWAETGPGVALMRERCAGGSET